MVAAKDFGQLLRGFKEPVQLGKVAKGGPGRGETPVRAPIDAACLDQAQKGRTRAYVGGLVHEADEGGQGLVRHLDVGVGEQDISAPAGLKTDVVGRGETQVFRVADQARLGIVFRHGVGDAVLRGIVHDDEFIVVARVGGQGFFIESQGLERDVASVVGDDDDGKVNLHENPLPLNRIGFELYPERRFVASGRLTRGGACASLGDADYWGCQSLLFVSACVKMREVGGDGCKAVKVTLMNDSQPSQVKEWVRQKAQDLVQLYLSWVILAAAMLLALVLYVVVFHYQADEPNRGAGNRVWSQAEIASSDASYTVTLTVLHPELLRLDPPSEAARPLSVWLTVVDLLHPPTATLEPWTVTLAPHDGGVLFTDREGVPIAPQVTLTPSVRSSMPAVLYIQHASSIVAGTKVSLTVQVYERDNLLQQLEPKSLVVRLENRGEAQSRRFWDLVWGPTTPLLVFAGGLVLFAVEEWRLGRERTQKRKEERLARVGELKGWSHDIILAARRYRDYRQRTETERGWRDPGLRERLDDTWRKLFDVQTLQDKAVWQLVEGNFDAAEILAELAQERDPKDTFSQTLLSLARCDDSQGQQASQTRTGLESSPSSNVKTIVQACLTVYSECAYREEVSGVRKMVAERLATLIRQGYIEVVARELENYRYVLDLLGEPEFEEPLKEENRGMQAWELIHRRWEALRLPSLWPAKSPTDLPAISNWVNKVGLKFNPFGPMAAELDHRLKDYGVQAVFEKARGKKPCLIFGPPGSGKTAAALLLAWYCEFPLRRPREADAFPVYYTLPTDVPCNTARLIHLEAAACATASAVARYLAHRREGFLSLSLPEQYNVMRLLSLWAGSDQQLATALQRAGPSWGTSNRLISKLTALHQDVSREEMTEQAYLDLLGGARPGGFECLYLLADLRVGVDVHALAVAHPLRSLLDLVIPLAARGVHLKLFLPDSLRPHLGDLTAHEVMALAWRDNDLGRMLETRFKSAGGDSLGALCVPPTPSVDHRLVEAANGSPRRLIRVGNALLATHVQQTLGAPQLSAEWAVSFLQTWRERNG